jgi:hypothetical protein
MGAFGVGNTEASAIFAGTRQPLQIVPVIIAIELPFDVAVASVPILFDGVSCCLTANSVSNPQIIASLAANRGRIDFVQSI